MTLFKVIDQIKERRKVLKVNARSACGKFRRWPANAKTI